MRGDFPAAAGAAEASADDHDRADAAFLHLHQASLSLLHRLAAAEDFLEAKAHALLGIGSESSSTFYGHLATLVRQRHGPMQVHGLATLLAPLVEHDRALLAGQRRAWLRRDRMMATQVLLRHLAVAVHRERPKFTLVDPEANDAVRLTDVTICSGVDFVVFVSCPRARGHIAHAPPCYLRS